MEQPTVSLSKLVAAQERLGRTLTDLLPFERPKLKSVMFKEPDTSPRVRADLNLLTNAELDLLEKLCLKASAGHTAPGLPGDADHQSPGGKIKARGARRTR